MIEALIFGVFCAAINHARGGGLWADRLPGHPRYYAAAAVALLTLVTASPVVAIKVGVCFLLWSWLPWGRWYDLGRITDDWPARPPNRFERVVTDFARGNDHIAFLARNAIGLLPAAILVSPLFMFLSFVQVAAYEAGWRLTPKTPIRTGELLTGFGWGVMIAVAA